MTLNPKHADYSDHPVELKYIYDKAFEASKKLPDDYIFVETGTRAGGSALAILNAIKDTDSKRWFFTIDPYGEKPYRIGDDFATNLEYDEGKYRTAMYELSSYAKKHELNHAHFRMKSTDFMNFFQDSDFWFEGDLLDQKFGFAYLDGDHDPITVRAELEGFDAKVTLVDDAHYLDEDITKLGQLVGDKLIINNML